MYPILFQIGPITLKSLGLFIVFGFFIGIFVLVKKSVRNKMNLDFISDHLIPFILAPLIVSRLIYVFENWYKFSTDFWSIFMLHDGNFSLWGGILGFVVILFYWTNKQKNSFWKWFDLSFLSAIISFSIIFLGLFFSGDVYGKPTDLPWGVTFDNPDVRFTDPIHPLQIYFSIAYFLIFIVLFNFSQKRRKDGSLALIGMVLFAGVNFLFDFLSGDRLTLIGEITINQIISLIVCLGGIFLLILRSHKIQKNNI